MEKKSVKNAPVEKKPVKPKTLSQVVITGTPTPPKGFIKETCTNTNGNAVGGGGENMKK